MRVPVNPQTNPSGQQQGYFRSVRQPRADYAANVLQEFSRYQQEEDRQRENFDISNALLDETNALQEDFNARENAPYSTDFAQKMNEDYVTRHKELVGQFQQKGYSEDAVRELDIRLGSIRSSFLEKAIEFQQRATDARNTSQVGHLIEGSSRYAFDNPSDYLAAIVEGDRAIDAIPNWTDAERVAAKDRLRKEVRTNAALRVAKDNPESILKVYDPGFLERERARLTGTGQAGPVASAPDLIKSEEGFIDRAKWDVNHYRVGYGSDTYTTADGQVHEVTADTKITREDAERDLARRVGDLTNKLSGSLGNAWLKFPDGVKAALISVAYNYGELPASVAEAVKAGDQQAVAAAIERLPDNPDRRKREAAAVRGASDLPIQEIKPAPAMRAGEPEVKDTLHTGTVLDDLSGDELAGTIMAAREEYQQRGNAARQADNEAEAAARAAHQEQLNTLLNGLNDGSLGEASIDKARSDGWLTDYDEINKAQGILESKKKDDQSLALFSVMWKNPGQYNPYDDTTVKAAEAGYKAGLQDIIKNGQQGQTTPQHVALQIWQKTGILVKEGAAAIRGGLISTDPAQVAVSASIASNMLSQNPNAFAGAEGGEEITKQAKTYEYYVDSLGMSAQQAAQKVAVLNDPEVKKNVPESDPTRQKFIKDTQAINVGAALNKAIFGEPSFVQRHTPFGLFDPPYGTFVTAPQRAEAEQTFMQFALDHYDQYHDAGAAQSYAASQMARFYGVVNGRLMKYPPTKGYPAVDGSREYVFDQAKEAVDAWAGFPVPKENIWLEPLAHGETADAYRSGRPAPYEVHFTTELNGQPVYHVIPGKKFVADVGEAQRKVREEKAKQSLQVREMRARAGQAMIEGGVN